MAATVIASQALISGVFSLTEQVSRLGFLPRLHIVHTSSTERGQVYLPKVNWILMVACLVLVLTFRSSANLAKAYGLAVLTGMTITSTFYFFHVTKNCHWPWVVTSAVIGVWSMLEVGFLVAASAKFFTGAWLPVMLTILLVVLMQTWRRGTKTLKRQYTADEQTSPKELFERRDKAQRILGSSGVLLSGQSLNPELVKYLDRFQALPEHTLLFRMSALWKPEYANRFERGLRSFHFHLFQN